MPVGQRLEFVVAPTKMISSFATKGELTKNLLFVREPLKTRRTALETGRDSDAL